MSDDNADKLTRLEEEGEIAADYLEELLDIADLDGDIEIDVENGRASVEIVADDPEALDRLVGEDGEVLDALQELTRLAVQTETGERSRLMLDIADLDGDIEIDVENGRASVEIVADDPEALDRLVGDDGEVLDALQELTRLAVQTETGERSRLMLDIAGFRAERKEELQDITREAIARVRATGEAVKLDAMNPFERKVCHDVVADEGLTSESEGTEPHRRVVILPEDTDGE